MDAAAGRKAGDGDRRQNQALVPQAADAALRCAAWAMPPGRWLRRSRSPAGAHTAAAAADTVFTVGNYPVEARAENAVTAKNRALADGQQAAFRSLLKRLVPVTAYQRLRQLRQVQAGDLVEGVRVRSERNSSTDYIASLDFSFQSKAVRDLLRREGIPFMDEQAPTLTLVPLWRSPASAAPKEEAAWTNVWKGLDLEHALTPVKLQALKKEIAPQRRQRAGRRRRQRHPRAGRGLRQRARAPGGGRAGHRGQAAQRHAHGARRRRRLHAQARLPPRSGRSRLRQRAGGRRLARHPRGPLEGRQVSRWRRRGDGRQRRRPATATC